MTRPFLVALSLCLLSAAAARAQINVPGPIKPVDSGSPGARGPRPAQPAPIGVPGSRADTSMTGPAAPGATDMPPTEALFDAINRGDIAASREAIGRGADIQGRNVLGLTPLELSVDLGRNDISFLLLSLRGGAGYGVSRPRQADATAAETPAQRRADRVAEQRARRQEAAATRASARGGPTGPVAPRSARLFAGDGGAPVPQAGFLGFGATR